MKAIFIESCAECDIYGYASLEGHQICGHPEVMVSRSIPERATPKEGIATFCPLQEYVQPNSKTMARGA